MQKKESSSAKVLARQEKIKKVALEHFLSKGYEATNLKDVIKESGGSLSNIYNHWKNKENLFFSIVLDRIKEERENFDRIVVQSNSKDLNSFLFFVAEHFISIFNKKDTIALAKIFYSQFYANFSSQSSVWLKESREFFIETLVQNRFEIEENPLLKQNAERLARFLFLFIKEYCLERVIIYGKAPMNKKEQKEYTKFVTEFFLKAIQ